MTSILTFCTANIPASVFNRLLEESAQAENAVPFLCLIRTPDQEEVDNWGTEGPIEDFETGFLGKSEDELRHYSRQFIAERGTFGTISQRWMAVLDETCTENSTILFYFSMKKESWYELYDTIPENGKVFDDGYIWWQWRIPFKYAFSFFINVEYCEEDVMKLFCRPEYLRADGVIDVETCDKIIHGKLPDPLGIVGGGTAPNA